MKRLLINLCIYTWIVGYWTPLSAQQIKAKLTTENDGLQAIHIPQEFRAAVGNNIGYLRIKNSDGVEVPFILRPAKSTSTAYRQVDFEKKSYADSTESFLIKNKDKSKKQHYTFKIGNSTASKNYKIEGSNDSLSWFSLVSQGSLSGLSDDNETFVRKNISFPLSDYRYMRITIDNKTSAPIHILGIEELQTTPVEEKFEKLKGVYFQQQDDRKNKISLINIEKDNLSPVDFIRIHISSPSQYLREAQVYKKQERKQANRQVQYEEVLAYITLTNTNSNEFAVNSTNVNSFYFRIFNEDNPALKIDSISLFQKPLELIADLQKNGNYSLETDTNWSMPSYDLAKVKLDLPQDIPFAKISGISKSHNEHKAKESNYGKIMLILGSILGVGVAFYFGNSLLKDMKKEKQDDGQ